MSKKNIAKRPEATRNITKFSPLGWCARGRWTAGRAARRSGASMRMNEPSRTIASAKKPNVCSEAQPFSSALTIPYTSATAPRSPSPRRRGRSSCARARRATPARSGAPRRRTAIPTGTFTKKIHGHDRYSTRMPPRTRPNGAAADGDRRPDADRLRALCALRERRRDDRERGGGDERAAEALQLRGRRSACPSRREAVEQRRGGEHDEADDEDALAAEEVARAAAEQQEAAERQRVAVDDPLQVGLAEPEVRAGSWAARRSRSSRPGSP